MKKLFSVMLVVSMLASMSLTAFAAGNSETNTGGNSGIKVTGDVVEGTTGSVISADISWENMTFNYTAGSQGVWQPDSHSYSGGTKGAWSDNKPAITVTNHSNAAIIAEFDFTSAVSGLVGTFYSKNGETYTALTADTQNAILSAATENSAQTAADSAVVCFGVSGGSIDKKTTLGTIYVNISKKAALTEAELEKFTTTTDSLGRVTITGVKDAYKGDTELVVPDGVYSVECGALKDCTNLQKLTVPYVGNRSNGEYGSIGYFFGAKSYTDNLTVMPESLTNITVTGGYNNDETLKTGAFYDCRYLTDVVIGDGVTAMGNGIFYDNFALTNLTVPFAGESKKTYPDSYMYPFNWLFTYSTSDSESMYLVSIVYNKLSSPWSTATSSFNKTMYGYVPLSLKQITVNDGSIPYSCFYAFNYVEKIVLNDGVDYIGTAAFTNCKALTELIIPDSVTRVSDNIASNNGKCPVMATMAEKAKNGDGYWYIGKVLYRYYGAEEDLVVKDGTVSICSRFLADNTNISNIKTVKCPDSLRYIGCEDGYEGTCLFYGCTNLTKVELNEGLEFIHDYAFYNCTALSDIDFPDSVKYVGFNAFYDTAWYNNLPDGDVYIGKVYYKYKGEMTEDTTVTIKDGTYCISGGAFSNTVYYSTTNENDKLVAVNIPDSVEWIAGGAFVNCVGLKSITLPKNLTRLGERAFCNCTSLEGTVVVPTGVEILSTEVFYETNISELRFAEGSKLKYLSTESIPSGCTTWLPSSVERFVKYIKRSGDAIIMLPADADLVLEPYWHGDELSTSATICYMGSVADYYKYGDFVAYYSEEEPEKNPDGTYVGVAYDGYNYKGSYWHYDENGKPVLW